MSDAEKEAINLIKYHGTNISYALREYQKTMENEGFVGTAEGAMRLADRVDDVFLRLARECEM